MGDPSKPRKQYARPLKPWQKERNERDKAIRAEYGLKNQREIWKVDFALRNFTKQAKRLIAEHGPQAELEKKQLMGMLGSLGLVDENADIMAVLNLTMKDLLERRLQTLVFKKNLARSVKQARQFIIHRAIVVGDRKVAVPSYLVRKAEEGSIVFSPTSSLADPMHPERVQDEGKKAAAEKETAAKEELQSQQKTSAATTKKETAVEEKERKPQQKEAVKKTAKGEKKAAAKEAKQPQQKAAESSAEE